MTLAIGDMMGYVAVLATTIEPQIIVNQLFVVFCFCRGYGLGDGFTKNVGSVLAGTHLYS